MKLFNIFLEGIIEKKDSQFPQDNLEKDIKFQLGNFKNNIPFLKEDHTGLVIKDELEGKPSFAYRIEEFEPSSGRSPKSYHLEVAEQFHKNKKLDKWNLPKHKFDILLTDTAVVSTGLGYLTSLAAPIVGLAGEKIAAITKKEPSPRLKQWAGVILPKCFRGLYNGGSGFLSLLRLPPIMNDSTIKDGKPIKKESIYGPLTTILSLASVTSAGFVMFSLLTKNPGTWATLFRSSFGFNVTGLTGTGGAITSALNTAKKSEHNMQQCVRQFSEQTGISEKNAKEITLNELTHVTEDETFFRVTLGMTLSAGGSFFGGIVGLASVYPQIFHPSRLAACTTGLTVASGLCFSLGLVVSTFGLPNPREGDLKGECKYTPEKNEHFLVIQETARGALLPWALLTGIGAYALFKGLKGSSIQTQAPIDMRKLGEYIFGKNDNLFVAASVTSSYTQGSHTKLSEKHFEDGRGLDATWAVRALYLGFNRPEIQTQVSELLGIWSGEERSEFSPYVNQCVKRMMQRAEQCEGYTKRIEEERKQPVDKETTR